MVKTELYYDWEGDDPDIFERDLEKCIDWYSNVRIKRCLDGHQEMPRRKQPRRVQAQPGCLIRFFAVQETGFPAKLGRLK